jgi:hypothetical protein
MVSSEGVKGWQRRVKGVYMLYLSSSNCDFLRRKAIVVFP